MEAEARLLLRAGAVLVVLVGAVAGFGLLGSGSGQFPATGTPSFPTTGRTPVPLGRSAPGLVVVAERPGGALGVDDADVMAISTDGRGQLDLTVSSSFAERSPAWTADGHRVAFIARTMSGSGPFQESGGLFVMNADGTGRRLVMPCASSSCPSQLAWSADGHWLAFVDQGEVRYRNGSFSSFSTVRVTEVDGAGTRELCPFGRPGCPQAQGDPAWAPDGRTVLFSDRQSFRGLFVSPYGGLYAAMVDGSGTRRFSRPECLERCPFDASPAWSPDGMQVAWARELRSGTGLRHQIITAAPDGTNERVIFDCSQPACYGPDTPIWSPDGSRIALVNTMEGGANEIRLLDADGAHARLIRPCTDDGRCLGVGELAWSPDGTEWAFLTSELRSSLWIIGVDGEALRSIADDIECCLAWLPDVPGLAAAGGLPARFGSVEDLPPAPLLPGLLAIASDDGRPNEPAVDIYTILTDGSELRQLTTNPDYDSGPVWSPDGRTIAFASYRRGVRNTEVFTMGVDGSNQQPLTTDRYGAHPFSWSPDGRRLLFGCEDDHATQAICTMDADGSNRGFLIRQGSGAWDAAFSPDGQRVAFTADVGSRGEGIWLADADGSDHRVLIDLPGSQSGQTWSPDGQSIAFVWNTLSGEDIYSIDVDGSNLRRVTDLPGFISGLAWSPDGSWIAFVQGTSGAVHPEDAVLLVHPDGSALSRVFADQANIADVAWQPSSNS